MPDAYFGDVWFADLDPLVGHEQAGRRPVLVLPMTTTIRPLPSRVPISPPGGGLTRPRLILCEGIRSVSHDRLERRLGVVGPATLAAVRDRLRILLNL